MPPSGRLDPDHDIADFRRPVRRPTWSRSCGNGAGSAASDSAGRPRTSGCSATCASSDGGGWTPGTSRMRRPLQPAARPGVDPAGHLLRLGASTAAPAPLLGRMVWPSSSLPGLGAHPGPWPLLFPRRLAADVGSGARARAAGAAVAAVAVHAGAVGLLPAWLAPGAGGAGPAGWRGWPLTRGRSRRASARGWCSCCWGCGAIGAGRRQHPPAGTAARVTGVGAAFPLLATGAIGRHRGRACRALPGLGGAQGRRPVLWRGLRDRSADAGRRMRSRATTG